MINSFCELPPVKRPHADVRVVVSSESFAKFALLHELFILCISEIKLGPEWILEAPQAQHEDVTKVFN